MLLSTNGDLGKVQENIQLFQQLTTPNNTAETPVVTVDEDLHLYEDDDDRDRMMFDINEILEEKKADSDKDSEDDTVVNSTKPAFYANLGVVSSRTWVVPERAYGVVCETYRLGSTNERERGGTSGRPMGVVVTRPMETLSVLGEKGQKAGER